MWISVNPVHPAKAFDDILVTPAGIFCAFSEFVIFILPSFVVTVIVTLPNAFAVTNPVLSTIAIDESLDDHATVLSYAFDG